MIATVKMLATRIETVQASDRRDTTKTTPPPCAALESGSPHPPITFEDDPRRRAGHMISI